MFNFKNLLILILIVFIGIQLPGLTSQLQVPKKIKWTESLKLRDFYLLSNFTELKDKIHDYKNILAKNYEETPDVFGTAVEYGLVLTDLRELDKAQIVWEKAIKDFRNNDVPKVYKAWVDAYRGDFSQAKDIWYKIIKEKVDRGIIDYAAGIWLPQHVDSVIGLYLIKDNLPLKEKEEVTEMVLKIAKSRAAEPKFTAILISEELKKGNIEPANELIEFILKTNPENSILLTLKGVSNLLSNNFEDALKLFLKSNELYPNSPTNNLMKARTLFALKYEKDSLQAIDKAITLDPALNISKWKKKKFLDRKSYSSEVIEVGYKQEK